jgi:hypothetical protein
VLRRLISARGRMAEIGGIVLIMALLIAWVVVLWPAYLD